jgi:hypothetical protein
MDEIRCRIEAAFRRPDGVALVRVRQLELVSWMLGDDASLGGYAISPVSSGPGSSPPDAILNYEPGLFMGNAQDFLIFDFELRRADDLVFLTPGKQVMLRPGIPRIGRGPRAV